MTSHTRRADTSSESYQPPTTPNFERDVAASLKLLNILDPIEDETLEHQDPLAGDLDIELCHVLSVHSIISTTSSSAERNATAQSTSNYLCRKIGAGACGAIFARDGQSVIIKLAKAGGQEQLWNDFTMHQRIFEAFQSWRLSEVKIPICYGFESKDSNNPFWEENSDLLKIAEEVVHLPTPGLRAERILPLPHLARSLLIEKFCPERLRGKAQQDPANKDCLVRIYLGSLKGKATGMFFSLRNFKLHLNQMLAQQLDVFMLTSEMAKALAMFHWAAKVDARDVEFVLGSSTVPLPVLNLSEVEFTSPHPQEDFNHRKTMLWVLDFNQVRPISLDIDGVAQAVEAFRINDPYYPRPLQKHPIAQQLWNRFVHEYLVAASKILVNEVEDIKSLPTMFLEQVIELQRKKEEANHT